MVVFAKDGIEIRNLLRARPLLVEPAEPVYELERTGEIEAQRKNREVRNQEKRVGWENHVIRAQEKGVLSNSYRWDEADARVRSYLFLCLGAEGQRKIQQKRVNLVLHNVITQEFMTTLEDIFVTNRILAFERYNFICRKQKKTEKLEQFHADLVELASRADCGDRKSEWVRDMFLAQMHIEKIAEELSAQTQSPQDAYEYTIRREKGIEHSRTMKINPFGGQTTPKQEPIHFIYRFGVVDIIRPTIKTHKESEVVSAVDHIHLDHKTQEDNKEITIQTVTDNVLNAETNTIRIICNLARQKIKFDRNVPNEVILQKFADLQMLII